MTTYNVLNFCDFHPNIIIRQINITRNKEYNYLNENLLMIKYMSVYIINKHTKTKEHYILVSGTKIDNFDFDKDLE